MEMVFGETKLDLPDDPDKALVIDDMSIEAYHDLGNIKKHGDKAILSKSQLSDILDCPAKFKFKHIDGGSEDDKDYFTVGNAIHTLALEPQTFADRFYILPEGIRRDKRTDAYKAVLNEAGGKKILTAGDFADVKAMAAALASDRKAKSLLEAKGWAEQTIIWTDKDTGLRLRCRPDFRRADGLVIDLKTAASAEPRKFMRAAFDLHYDVSVAMTAAGVSVATGKPIDNYVFLVVEKSAPYVIEAFDSFRPFDPEDMSKTTYMDAGSYRYRKALDLFLHCRKNNKWPGYSDTINPMAVPAWEIKNLEKGE